MCKVKVQSYSRTQTNAVIKIWQMSILLCNSTAFLYTSFHVFPSFSLPVSITSASLNKSPASFLMLLPPSLFLFFFLSCLICQGYIICVSLPLEQKPSNPRPHLAFWPILCHPGRDYGSSQASHGIIQLTWPEMSLCVLLMGGMRVSVFVRVAAAEKHSHRTVFYKTTAMRGNFFFLLIFSAS